jgi:DNA invertase Pin-like site-specific DNA recombinase
MNAVFVRSFSRFGRDFPEVLSIVDKLNDLGAGVLFESENIFFSSRSE